MPMRPSWRPFAWGGCTSRRSRAHHGAHSLGAAARVDGRAPIMAPPCHHALNDRNHNRRGEAGHGRVPGSGGRTARERSGSAHDSAHALPYHPEASGGAGAHDSVLALPWAGAPSWAARRRAPHPCPRRRGQARRRGQLVEEHRTLGVGAPSWAARRRAPHPCPGAPSWAARRRAPHPCPPGDEAGGRPPRLYGWVRALPLRPPPVRC